jgi:DMSO reductase family type II enzyme molybdopterin subunit
MPSPSSRGRKANNPRKGAESSLEYPDRSWEELYREKWRWDKVTWGSHCVDCYPSNCSYRVYSKDGIVVREEPAGVYPTIEDGVPDMNPMGCQKGACWSQLLYGQERVLHPLKRAGERGEGKWTRISWDEALTQVADTMLDAIQEVGPESIIRIGEPAEGGTQSLILSSAAIMRLGGITTDVQSEINDFSPGIYVTFGKFDPAASVDDWFHTDLMLIWHINPVYTSIPWYHFIAEGRYRGAEVVTIAPDYSPSAIHADYHTPVRPGTDAALALSICQVLIEEGIYHADFVKEQTDLSLLVRLDNKRFLRGPEVDSGRDDQFYFYDTKSQKVVEASRATLALGDVDPALEGRFKARLADGSEVEVTPVFELLKEHLKDYTPEKATQVCGVHPDFIRMVARKAAQKSTRVLMGWNSGKYYHGDLMERSMMLVLALTGNWGKKGTGARSWAVGMFDGMFLFGAKQRQGAEATQEAIGLRDMLMDAIRVEDPTMTDEMVINEQGYRASAMGGFVPSAFFWYYHCGYRDIWNKKEWGDPTMKRSFDEYMKEGIERGWYDGFRAPDENTPPRVIFEIGSNLLRRQRGGQTMLLKHLWPKTKLIVTIDWRMNTTALYSDIFLPAAHHYEKPNFCYTSPHILNVTLSDKAVDPPGEAKSEWEITLALAKKLEERSKARGFTEFTLKSGFPVTLDNLYDTLTANGAFADADNILDEMVKDSAIAGTLPEGTSLQTLREKGFVRFIDWGISSMALAQASDLKPNETHAPFRWHTEKKMPFPTLTRRAQFYIDHDWFLEAGEELPTHKETPQQGGDYPFLLTSGHPRWSIHSMNMTNRIILQTHQGRPFMFMNEDDAAARGIEDGEEVRVFNDMSSMSIWVKVTSAMRPGQVMIYNGFEPYQFRQWQDPANIEPGMVKWLHFAGGYGHLRYRAIHWQPIPIDRAIHVDVAKMS